MKKFLLIATLVCSFAFVTGCTQYVEVEVPTGENCPENIAYLQSGVDAYYEDNGAYPADLEVLLEEGYIAEILECPGGNEYVIIDGIVVEQ